LLVDFCQFVRAIFVQFGGISFSYLYFYNTEDIIFYYYFIHNF